MHQAVTQKINKSSQILHIEYFGTVWCNRSPAAPLQLGNSLKVRIQKKHCQRHNGPKTLSTLTQSTPLVQNRSFNKLWNLGQHIFSISFSSQWVVRWLILKAKVCLLEKNSTRAQTGSVTRQGKAMIGLGSIKCK